MALKKPQILKSGVIAEYYRIVQLNCNYDDSIANCTLAIYIDEASRLAGKLPLGTLQISLGGEFQNANYDDSEVVMEKINKKEAYKAIKRILADESNKIAQDEEYRSLYENTMFLLNAEDV